MSRSETQRKAPSKEPRVRRRLAFVTSHPIQYQAPLFRALAREPGVDLTVFFCSDHGTGVALDPGFGTSFKWDTPLLEGYRHEFIPNRSPVPALGSFFGEVNPGLIWRLARGEFDAVLVHGYAYAACWLAFIGAKLGRAKLLMRMESHLLEPRAKWKQVVKQVVLRPAFRLFDACLPIGSLNYEYYRYYGVSPLKLVYAPYSVDNDFFRDAVAQLRPKRAAIRQALGLPEVGPVALFCGKLISKKAPMDFLKALELAGVQGLHGLVIGDGALRSECEDYARRHLGGRVVFTGFKNQTEIPPLQAASDLLVVPSLVEPWGLVVNEAMASGMPVIASSLVGAAPDLLRDMENGFIFPAGNPEALGRALDRAFAPGVLQALSQAASRRMESWSLDATVRGVVRAVG